MARWHELCVRGGMEARTSGPTETRFKFDGLGGAGGWVLLGPMGRWSLGSKLMVWAGGWGLGAPGPDGPVLAFAGHQPWRLGKEARAISVPKDPRATSPRFQSLNQLF